MLCRRPWTAGSLRVLPRPQPGRRWQAPTRRHRREAEYQTVSPATTSRSLTASTEKGGEIAAVFALLEEVPGDTTRDTGPRPLPAGGASETYAALDTIDWEHARRASASNPAKAMGDQRHIHTMTSGYAAQVKSDRRPPTLKTGVDSREVAYGITSLSPEQADARCAQSRLVRPLRYRGPACHAQRVQQRRAYGPQPSATGAH